MSIQGLKQWWTGAALCPQYLASHFDLERPLVRLESTPQWFGSGSAPSQRSVHSWRTKDKKSEFNLLKTTDPRHHGPCSRMPIDILFGISRRIFPVLPLLALLLPHYHWIVESRIHLQESLRRLQLDVRSPQSTYKPTSVSTSPWALRTWLITFCLSRRAASWSVRCTKFGNPNLLGKFWSHAHVQSQK